MFVLFYVMQGNDMSPINTFIFNANLSIKLHRNEHKNNKNKVNANNGKNFKVLKESFKDSKHFQINTRKINVAETNCKIIFFLYSFEQVK